MKGLSTIELLIAIAVLSLGMAAAVIVVFGTQSAQVRAQENREALSIASKTLEEARASADQNFAGVASLATTTDGSYRTWRSVADLNVSAKQVTGWVSWNAGGVARQTALSTLLTNWRGAMAGAAYRCQVPPAGDWSAPQARGSYPFSSLIPSGASGWGLSDIEIKDTLLYVAAYSTPAADKNTFFIFDISNAGAAPRLLGALATAPTYTKGIAAIAMAASGQKMYAYAASASSFSKGQLQIIDATHPAAPVLVATYKIAASIVPRAGYGRAIFYRYPYVYLGLTSIAGGGAEFDVINVSNPLNPFWVAGYSIGHDVNAIYVKGNYAYVAHPSASTDALQEELTVLDVTDPAATPALARVGGFHFVTGMGGHGETIDIEGPTLYFGRTTSNISGPADTIPEFYILDNSSAPSISSAPLGSAALGTGDSINALYARNSRAFLLDNYEFRVLDIYDPAHLLTLSTIPLTSAGLAFDCSSALIYITQAGAITTIAPGH